jgi:putative molybdopterin biosynthesis protein
MQVQNSLAIIRQQRGLSAAALAARVGVKRQTIYAIEAQRYVPNTLVALRLAEVLDVPVERMFTIKSGSHEAPETQSVHLLMDPVVYGRTDQPVRICRVGSRVIGVPSLPVLGELPAADAVVVGPGKNGQIRVRPFRAAEDGANRLLAAGCDPGIPVLARHLFKHGNIELITTGCSSLQALTWLKEGRIHVAGTHLGTTTASNSNLEAIGQCLPRGGYKVVTFASWEEGLVVAPGNPKNLKCAADLARPDVVMINREVGSGSRFLLDSNLQKAGLAAACVQGYDQTTQGHILAAWHVHTGRADCCIATQSSARVFGLDFIPWACERYDLVVRKQHWELPAVQNMLDALNRSSLKNELTALAGYDTSETGRLVKD